jgi:hypothetical protein
MRSIVVAAALALPVLAAACGDEAEALTADEWVTQADAVCAAGNERAEAIYGENAEPTEAMMRDLIDNISEQIDDIDDLAAPDEIGDDVDALVAEARRAIGEIEAMSFDELMGNEDDLLAETSRLARELGLTECGD